jgi:hypothetical protein
MRPPNTCENGWRRKRRLKIDIKDVSIASRAFGKRIGDLGWNSEADINGDNRIDVIDIAMISRRFGSTCQT